MALNHDLQKSKSSLVEFKDLTVRIINNINEMTQIEYEKNGYVILKSSLNTEIRFCRPFNKELLIRGEQEFLRMYELFCEVLLKVKKRSDHFEEYEYQAIDKVVYTIQQSISIGMDLYVETNSSRKHVGNRFEELIRLIICEIGLANDKIILKIPFENGDKPYRCETDIVFSKDEQVKSNSKRIADDEIVVSLKTSSKDRMGKIFIDKMLMTKFCKKNVKVIGIFHNDVQRKKPDSISFTFVSGLFMVYTQFLVKLDGVYFIDPPPHIKTAPFNEHIFRFSKFIIEDAYNLIN